MRPSPIGFAGPKGLTSLQILHLDIGDQIADVPPQIGAAVANVTTPPGWRRSPRPVRSVPWRCGRARPTEPDVCQTNAPCQAP